MAFARDGRLLAIDDAGRVRLVDPDSGREVATLDAGTGSSANFFCMAFSPDGTYLAAGRDHIIHLWDLRRIREHLAALGLDWDAPSVPASRPAPAPGSGGACQPDERRGQHEIDRPAAAAADPPGAKTRTP